MDDIALAWADEGRAAAIVRVAAAEGLGPRPSGDVLLVDGDGTTAGSVLGGAVQADAIGAARSLLTSDDGQRLVDLAVGTDDATAAGLTCGGTVSLLVQRLADVPTRLWDVRAAGRPVALVTLFGGAAMVVEASGTTTGSLGDEELDGAARREAQSALGSGGASVAVVETGERRLLVESWNPLPHVVVVGAGDLATALSRQAELLGWTSAVSITVDGALAEVEAAGSLALVVIDHDPGVATPVLAAALRRGGGYVGALGSRRTQVTRRTHLVNAGVGEDDIARMHGPTGLDLGARSAAETAVSIVAEIIAERSGRSAVPLATTTGRISA